MIKRILLPTLLILILVVICRDIFVRSFNVTASTSYQSISGLWKPKVFVSGYDIPIGTTKICTGLNYVNIKVSEYDEKKLEEYIQEGIKYDQPQVYSEEIKPFSCTSITLESNMVVEGFNHDWGAVKYYIKFEGK